LDDPNAIKDQILLIHGRFIAPTGTDRIQTLDKQYVTKSTQAIKAKNWNKNLFANLRKTLLEEIELYIPDYTLSEEFGEYLKVKDATPFVEERQTKGISRKVKSDIVLKKYINRPINKREVTQVSKLYPNSDLSQGTPKSRRGKETNKNLDGDENGNYNQRKSWKKNHKKNKKKINRRVYRRGRISILFQRVFSNHQTRD